MTFTSGPSASNNKICFVDIYPTVPMPNTIATNPQSARVVQNRPAAFNVVVAAGGPEPYGFQWYFNNSPIAGANGQTYTIPQAQLSDMGPYFVVVTNAGAAATSAVATLTVLADTNAPGLLSATRPTCTDTTLQVAFDEDLDSVSATTVANYEIVNLTAGFSFNTAYGRSISAAVLGADARTVTLTATGSLTNGALYKLTVKDVKDLVLNNLGQGSTLVTLKGALLPAGPQNLVVVEAENADTMTPREYDAGTGLTLYYWAFNNSRAGFSGAGVMQNLPNLEGTRPGGAEGASLDFCVNFPAAGTYYAWVRGGADGGGDNSVNVGIDSNVPLTGVNLQTGFQTAGYAWCGTINDDIVERATLDVPSAGYHSVSIFMREDGFYADKLLLTLDVGYTPTGLGPDETPREQAMPPMIGFVPGTLLHTGTGFSVNVQTVAGLTNVVEYKNALDATPWTTLTSFLSDGAVKTITDTGPLPAGRFYRARVIIP